MYTRSQYVLFVLIGAALLAQHFFWPRSSDVVFGSLFILIGVVYLARGKFTVKDKAGLAQVYTGRRVYIWSIVFIAFGTIFFLGPR